MSPAPAFSRASDSSSPLDETRAYREQRAVRTRWNPGPAPTATDKPHRKVDRAGPRWIEATALVDHVIPVVAVREAGAQEDPANVDVVGDIGTVKRLDRYLEVSFEHFDRHRGLLLTDPVERQQPALDLIGGRFVAPDPSCIATVIANDPPGGGGDPRRDRVDETLEHGRSGYCLRDAGEVVAQSVGVQMP
jgi:hypothetical protein